jgi:hypothetical protein
VLSVTATKQLLAVVAAGLLGSAAAASEDLTAIENLHKTVAAYAAPGIPLPDAATLTARCGSDMLCAAELVVEAFGGGARLEAVEHPDSDSIRLVTTEPSVGTVRRLSGGHVLIALDRFGRDAVQELRQAVSEAGAGKLILDLRANGGGSLKRMMRLASLFTGPVGEALWIGDGENRRPVAIPAGPPRLDIAALAVLVGPATASSAEMLAALLRQHGGATVVGQRTFGKDYLTRVIPVHHDWRLLIPAERIEVPGEVLAGGLIPDHPEASVELPSVEWP